MVRSGRTVTNRDRLVTTTKLPPPSRGGNCFTYFSSLAGLDTVLRLATRYRLQLGLQAG